MRTAPKVVNVETSFVAPGALGRGKDSVLGLDLDDLDAEFRIYLLRCASGGNSSFLAGTLVFATRPALYDEYENASTARGPVTRRRGDPTVSN